MLHVINVIQFWYWLSMQQCKQVLVAEMCVEMIGKVIHSAFYFNTSLYVGEFLAVQDLWKNAKSGLQFVYTPLLFIPSSLLKKLHWSAKQGAAVCTALITSGLIKWDRASPSCHFTVYYHPVVSGLFTMSFADVAQWDQNTHSFLSIKVGFYYKTSPVFAFQL